MWWRIAVTLTWGVDWTRPMGKRDQIAKLFEAFVNIIPTISYRDLDWWAKVIYVNVERSVFFATKVIFISLETRFEGRTIVIDQNEFFFIDVFVHLQQTPTQQISSRSKTVIIESLKTLADLTLILSFAMVEHWTLNSKSRSGLSGTLRKLICLMWRSSFLDRLKVNWKSSCKS